LRVYDSVICNEIRGESTRIISLKIITFYAFYDVGGRWKSKTRLQR
jgi:hypothetical protein